MQNPIGFGNFKSSGDAKKDIEDIVKLLAKFEGFVVAKLPDGLDTTFKTADTPAKTITVKRGVINSSQ